MDFNMRFQGVEAKPFKESQKEGVACQHETIWHLPSQVGKGTIRRIRVASGFILFLADYQINQSLTIDIDYPRPGLGFGFFISGSARGQARGMRNNVRGVGGQSNIIYYQDQTGVTTDAPNSHRQSVSIILEPEVFLSMFHDGFGNTTTDLCRIGERSAGTPLLHFQGLTTQMYTALNQVFNTPLNGPTRKLYLEGKALELIALRVNTLLDLSAKPKETYRFSTADMGRINDAAELLAINMLTPPTLSTLSRTVGLSHTKLNRGFRKAFGTTVFGYLRRVRLQRAKRFLESRQMNVTEASFAVGYNSLSSFSKAFQGQFGIPPHSCIKNG